MVVKHFFKKPKGKAHKKPAPPKKVNKLGEAGRAELRRLRNIQANQFGALGDQAYLKKLARQVDLGKKAPGSQDWKVRAGRATRDPQALRAGRTVQADLNPQISAAKNYESGLQTLYANLGNQLNSFNQQIAGTNASTRAQVGTRYDQLASQIANEFNASKQSSASELNRLGINMPDASQSSDIQNRLAMIAESGRQNALSQQDASSQAANQLMGLLQGEAQATGAGFRAASSQQRGMLEASRPGKVYSLWQELEDAAREQKAENQQQKFLNRITQAKFGVDQDYKTAQSLSALASARKNIVASRKPRKVRKARITR
jgi:hypothetical protein